MPYYRRGSRWPYRSWRRWGTSRSQKSGTRRFSVSIPVEGYRSVGVASNSHVSYSVAFTPFYSSANTDTSDPEYSHHIGNLIGHNLFTTYCQLYDEVKLNSMSISIAVDQVPAGSNGVKIISCVDRHATLNDIRGQYLTQNMAGSAESDSRMFSSLQNARVYRYLAARDISERTNWFDCTLGQANYTTGGNTYAMAGPLEFIQNSSLFACYNPIVFVGFSFSAAPAAAGTVYFQYKVTYNLTFRNPKFGGSGAAKFGDMLGDVISDVKREEDESGEVEESTGMEETPVLKKKKVVYEEEVLPDDEDEEDDDDELVTMTQPFKSPVKKAGKKSS